MIDGFGLFLGGFNKAIMIQLDEQLEGCLTVWLSQNVQKALIRFIFLNMNIDIITRIQTGMC